MVGLMLLSGNTNANEILSTPVPLRPQVDDIWLSIYLHVIMLYLPYIHMSRLNENKEESWLNGALSQ